MPLDPDILGALIKTNVEAKAKDKGWPGFSDSDLGDFCDAIAAAVVSHIVANALVTVALVTPGTGTAVGKVT